jgi:hypothetical protein
VAFSIAAVTVLTDGVSPVDVCAAPQWMQKRVAAWLSLPHVEHCMNCILPITKLRRRRATTTDRRMKSRAR